MEKDRWSDLTVTHDIELVHELGKGGEEAELNQSLLICKKNPGHHQFIPMNDFSLHDLPEECRSEDMLEYMRACGDLTVRMSVSYTSTSRPDTYSDTLQGSSIAYYQPGGPFPFKDERGSACKRIGSGFVFQIDRGGEWQKEEDYVHVRDQLTGPCQCSRNCMAEIWARFEIITAHHLVYDQEEADHLEIEFFFNTDQDQTEGRTRKMHGGQVFLTSLEGDRCNLFIYTHDVFLIERQEAALRLVIEAAQLKLRQKESQGRDSYPVFVLGHPHGCGKVVTVGEVTEYRMDSEADEAFDPVTTFTAPTCPGSSGGPVVWFRYDSDDEKALLVGAPRPHCGSLKTCSVAGKKLGRCGQLFL